MKMKICGLQKLTLLDFPGMIACTVFLGGCNFRCPFCHNASLVTPERVEEQMSEDELFAFLMSRKGKLGGVCISGGEPTLAPDLYDFIVRLRGMGLAVKLDTNGSRPDVLKRLLSEGLLDYVAMDIKSSPDGYAAAVGRADFDISPIKESIELLRSSSVEYELRTTVVRRLHTVEHMRDIGRWLSGTEHYFLQSFADSGDILTPGCSACSDTELSEMLATLREYIPTAELR